VRTHNVKKNIKTHKKIKNINTTDHSVEEIGKSVALAAADLAEIFLAAGKP
jgi:hypothetical protein